MAKSGKLQEFIKDLKSDVDSELEDEDEVLYEELDAEAFQDKSVRTAQPTSLTVDPEAKRAQRKRRIRHILQIIKMVVLLIIWVYCFIGIAFTHVHYGDEFFVSIPASETKRQVLGAAQKTTKCIELMLKGHFDFSDNSKSGKRKLLNMHLERNGVKISDVWSLYLQSVNLMNEIRNSDRKMFQFEESKIDELELVFENEDDKDVVALMFLNTEGRDNTVSLLCGILVLIILYTLIIFDVVDRTFAAVLLCTVAIATLAFLRERPEFANIIYWIDTETLLLIFGMMILVAMLSETGVFDFLAVLIFKLTRGRRWPLVMTLSVFSGIASSFLDSITMVMLLTPVTIRLCEVMSLNSTTVLLSIVLLSNMGGSITSFGDPPNIIILSTKYVMEHDINVIMVLANMGPGLLLCMILTLLQLRYQLGKKGIRVDEDTEDAQLKKQIKTWRRAAEGITPYTAPEREMRDDMVKQVKSMQQIYRQYKAEHKDPVQRPSPQVHFHYTLDKLTRKYPIRNKPLLYKCCIALLFAVLMFFLQTIPAMKGLTASWSALLAVFLLIILAGKHRMGVILDHVDWAPLLFFAALFIIMEAVTQMGLIEFIGTYTIKIILSVNEEHRLAVAVVLMLWSTVVTSAIIDNVPVTSMMLKLVISLSKNKDLNLPLKPLLWALSFGVCLGGNATLFGASANIVCAGLAEQHNNKFSFMAWFKIGFPIMFTTSTFATFYLYITQVVFKWY